MTELLLLLAAVVLTGFTGFFVAAEFSLTTVDRGRAEEAAADGDSRGRAVVTALRTLSTQLSAAQFGITITTLVVGYLAEPAIGQLLHGPLEALGLPHRHRHRRGPRPRHRAGHHPADAARGARPEKPDHGQPDERRGVRRARHACLHPRHRPRRRRAPAAVQLDRAPARVRAPRGAGHRAGRRRAGVGRPPLGRGGRPVPRRRPVVAALARAGRQARHRRDDAAHPAVDPAGQRHRRRRHRGRHRVGQTRGSRSTDRTSTR